MAPLEEELPVFVLLVVVLGPVLLLAGPVVIVDVTVLVTVEFDVDEDDDVEIPPKYPTPPPTTAAATATAPSFPALEIARLRVTLFLLRNASIGSSVEDGIGSAAEAGDMSAWK